MNTIKNLMNRLTFVTLMLMSMAGSSAAQAMSAPEEVVRTTFDKIVSNIQVNRAVYENDNQALYQMLETDLVPSLNIPFMVDLILGKELATTSPASKRSELANEFKLLLLRTYATGILFATGDENVVYEPLELKPDAYRADVTLKLVTADGSEFPIKLQMTTRKSRWSRDTSSDWKAYNLEVAGQNIARLYRATFASTLKKEGIDGLIANLKSRNGS